MLNSLRVIATNGTMLAVIMIITSCVSAQENKGLDNVVSDNVVKVPTRFDQACNTEIDKYCSNVQAGDGRVASCLYAHTDLLEDECYAATSQIGTILERVFDGIEVFYAACQVDLGEWCPGVKSGTGGQIACLQENLDKISAGCSAAMPGTTASGR